MKKYTKNLGIDIGERYIKLICLQNNDHESSLIAHGIFSAENFHQLKKILKDPIFKKANLRVSLNDPDLITQRVEIAIEEKKDYQNAIGFRLENILRNSLSSYQLIYQFIHEDELNAHYLVFAIDKGKLKTYQNFLKQLGIKKYQLLEPELSANFLAFQKNYSLREDTACGLIDIGESKTTFSVFSGKGILYHMHLDQMAGSYLTSLISGGLGINPDKANQDKILYNENYYENEKLNHKFLQALEQYYHNCELEIKRALDSYLLEEPDLPLQLILLTGGGSKVWKLADRLTKKLDILCGQFETFRKVNCDEFGSSEALKDRSEFYSLALGLTL